ncbi:MAG TPA: winged helix-turn-helix domain-containing protein [Pseudobdellovibrionaceae bacterium]|nr:winged helix-turn-helix domain-containing protein [Pseudobdellovibrionaceae bacterium]
MDHLLVGKLYLKLLDFGKAQAIAEEGLALANHEGDFSRWSRLALFCLRLYKDTAQKQAFENLLAELKREESRNEVRSGLSYILGILSTEARDFEEADRLFEIAEISATRKEEEFHAGYGRAVNQMLQDRWSQALDILDQLEERMSAFHEPDVELAVQLTKARILWQLKKIDLSELAMEKARALVKVNSSLASQVLVLTSEAFRLLDRGDLEGCKKCWETIDRLLPDAAKPVYNQRLEALKKQLQIGSSAPQITLKTDGVHTVLRLGSSESDVTKLPQLVRLLVFLGEQSGRVFSKEEICAHIWGESYHPLRHDNKIYVTIRRLRALFHEIEGIPVIINRDDGYLFNSRIPFRKDSISSPALSKRISAASFQRKNESMEVL